MFPLDKAGFAFHVGTVSGNPVKFEFWAMPSEDETVKGCLNCGWYLSKKPLTVSSSEGRVQNSNLTGFPETVATSKAKPALSRWYMGSKGSTGWLPVEKKLPLSVSR